MANDLVLPLRGEVWVVNWNPARGSEQAGRRPSLILQTDAGNQNPNYPNTIVATVTKQGRDSIPTHVRLSATSENGLTYDSYVKCEQIMTISKDRLEDRLGMVSPDDMARVEAAIKKALALP
ncbi:MAG: type II toxin-antitoxin system PemK/MazF family toxin [Armatimonadaceae bacterium]